MHCYQGLFIAKNAIQKCLQNIEQVIQVILTVLITGSLWCALPKVYNNFRKWSQEGVTAKIFEKFVPNLQETNQIQIDATYVKIHQHSAGAKKSGSGRSYREIKWRTNQ